MEQYEIRVVKILDAQVEQVLGDGDSPSFTQFLHLLLQDIEKNTIFRTVLEEEDVRKIIGAQSALSSKQLIDLSILLREREEPLKLAVPTSGQDLTVADIIKTEAPKKRNRRRRKRNYKNNIKTKTPN